MASTHSLPDDLVAVLAEMYGEANPATKRRWTLRELADVASKQTGRTVDHSVVLRAIAPLRAEITAEARAVLRARVNARLPAQVEALDDLITKIIANANGAQPVALRKSVETLTKALAMKLRFSGVGERMEVDADVTLDGTLTVNDARSQLAARLALAAPGALARGPGAGGGEPLPGSGSDPPP